MRLANSQLMRETRREEPVLMLIQLQPPASSSLLASVNFYASYPRSRCFSATKQRPWYCQGSCFRSSLSSIPNSKSISTSTTLHYAVFHSRLRVGCSIYLSRPRHRTWSLQFVAQTNVSNHFLYISAPSAHFRTFPHLSPKRRVDL